MTPEEQIAKQNTKGRIVFATDRLRVGYAEGIERPGYWLELHEWNDCLGHPRWQHVAPVIPSEADWQAFWAALDARLGGH